MSGLSFDKRIDWRNLATWVLGLGLVVIVLFYSGRAILANSGGPVRLVVYAFSTQEEVLSQDIFPAFEQAWEAETGRDLTIEAVFGPSGTLAGQINLGAPADLALLSNEQHVNWLKVGRRVKGDTQPVVLRLPAMVLQTRRAGKPSACRSPREVLPSRDLPGGRDRTWLRCGASS